MDKLEKIRQVILDWDGKTGHDRCWYYPELFNKIADILEIQLTSQPVLPSREEFEAGCKRYQDEEFLLQNPNSVVE